MDGDCLDGWMYGGSVREYLWFLLEELVPPFLFASGVNRLGRLEEAGDGRARGDYPR